MTTRKMHEIWIEQVEAARGIQSRYGLKDAFDYLVAEKLLNYAGAAMRHPEFARELPRFVSQVRFLFTPDQIKTHIARVENELSESDAANADDDDVFAESPAAAAERARQFATINELLTATQLGTS